ncbi:hypothetical protein ACFQS3_11030 [Glycomyces mayteni]|uniref:Uncharacterized protein n=1 Tax=Glycomyces mayteni TaxID=543887 RepID=A0ABW2D9G3_9ACTN
MAYCRICEQHPVKAEGVVCDSCVGKIHDRASGRKVDDDDPAAREFDAEMAKFGPLPSPQKSSGCAVLALAVAAVPAALAVLGAVRLLA